MTEKERLIIIGSCVQNCVISVASTALTGFVYYHSRSLSCLWILGIGMVMGLVLVIEKSRAGQ